jgi:hypothetical protein
LSGENGFDGACITQGKGEKCMYKSLVEITGGRENVQDIIIEGWIISK